MPNNLDEEEEKVCLLSEQHNDSPGPHHRRSTGTPEPEVLENAEITDVLAAGEAERQFFKENSGSKSDEAAFFGEISGVKSGNDDPALSMASIEVVKDILTDIETGNRAGSQQGKRLLMSQSLPCHTSVLENRERAGNPGETCEDQGENDDDDIESCRHCMDKQPPFCRTSGSLVVDVHIPAESSEEGDFATGNGRNSRPCKHSVNRFQRCYSSGSHGSPKRKEKVRKN